MAVSTTNTGKTSVHTIREPGAMEERNLRLLPRDRKNAVHALQWNRLCKDMECTPHGENWVIPFKEDLLPVLWTENHPLSSLSGQGENVQQVFLPFLIETLVYGPSMPLEGQ